MPNEAKFTAPSQQPAQLKQAITDLVKEQNSNSESKSSGSGEYHKPIKSSNLVEFAIKTAVITAKFMKKNPDMSFGDALKNSFKLQFGKYKKSDSAKEKETEEKVTKIMEKLKRDYPDVFKAAADQPVEPDIQAGIDGTAETEATPGSAEEEKEDAEEDTAEEVQGEENSGATAPTPEGPVDDSPEQQTNPETRTAAQSEQNAEHGADGRQARQGDTPTPKPSTPRAGMTGTGGG
ncbi:MAG: hypothetical protein P1U34_01440 [Coxiellaceae bacterium]|nr:hypothetical protein [Coxiellaceae bacterium]